MVRIGLQEYNDMTPHELVLCVEVYKLEQKYQQDNDITTAWLTAAWQRAKKMDSLQKVLCQEEVKKKTTRPEDMLAKIKAAHEAMGGDTY